MADRDDIRRYRHNYREEVDGAALYRAMSDVEESDELATVYRELADVEARHAEFWARRLEEAGHPVRSTRPSARARLLCWMAKRFGAGVLVGMVADAESGGRQMYDDQPETEATTMRSDERSHAFLLGQIRGGVRGASLVRLESRHRAPGGNALRAAVLGANDGLLSNLSLVLGVAGSGVDSSAVLVAGTAGLLAGAFSMALGEWVSVQSSRELTERQLGLEAEEIAALPDEELEELRLIYQARGLPEDDAYLLAKRLLDDPENALDVMAREELGIDPDERGGSPWIAASSSFFLFSIGAFVPVWPFLVFGAETGVVVSAVAGAVGLFALGAATALFTGRNAIWVGARQMLLGLIAAAVTFGLGAALGAAVD